MRLASDERGQTSLEYLYLTAFVIGLAAVTALLVTDVLQVQEQAKQKLVDYRDRVLNKVLK
jgi:multisubunit Na+/H+ antiporter MnhC subunit